MARSLLPIASCSIIPVIVNAQLPLATMGAVAAATCDSDTRPGRQTSHSEAGRKFYLYNTQTSGSSERQVRQNLLQVAREPRRSSTSRKSRTSVANVSIGGRIFWSRLYIIQKANVVPCLCIVQCPCVGPCPCIASNPGTFESPVAGRRLRRSARRRTADPIGRQ